MVASRSTLFVHGTVRTLVPGAAPARWVWVEDGVVRAVGDGTPPETDAPRCDLHGRTLVPAFSDVHLHLTWVATSLLGCDLSQCNGVPHLLEALSCYSGPGRGPGGGWLVGYGFDETGWAEPRLPTRLELDALALDRPVLLQRICGHVGVVNSAALAALVPGPHTDLATGRLAEDDLYAANDRLRPSPGQLEAVLPEVAATLHTHGIASVHDVIAPEMLRALQTAAAAHRLRFRVSASIPARYLRNPPRAESPEAPAVHGAARSHGAPAAGASAFFTRHGLDDVPVERRDPWLRVLGIKLFLDGSLGARTAYLRAPYADAPQTRGVPLYTPGDLAALARAADDAGLQLMVHAIGDAALDLGLDALEPLVQDGNPHRHRFEHVEVTPPDLVERLARSGLWACMQPNFAARWSLPGGMNERRLGTVRHAVCNAYRSLRAAGVRMAFGSDCMPLGPLYGLHGAVQHPVAGERLDMATALALYTSAAAEMVFAEGLHGRIAPGLRADLAVLSADPVVAPDPAALRVEATYVDGLRVHG